MEGADSQHRSRPGPQAAAESRRRRQQHGMARSDVHTARLVMRLAGGRHCAAHIHPSSSTALMSSGDTPTSSKAAISAHATAETPLGMCRGQLDERRMSKSPTSAPTSSCVQEQASSAAAAAARPARCCPGCSRLQAVGGIWRVALGKRGAHAFAVPGPCGRQAQQLAGGPHCPPIRPPTAGGVSCWSVRCKALHTAAGGWNQE